MLRLDTVNTQISRVGEEHGLDLTREFESARRQIHDIVTQLYQAKDESGGWKRWLALGYDEGLCNAVTDYARQIKGRYSDMVILGIGGSSLGGYALLKALLHPYWNNLSDEQRKGRPRFHFVENVDADQVAGLMSILDPARTLVVVITKSGTTAETMSAFMVFKDWLENLLTPARAKEHIVAITDPQTGILRAIVNQEGYASFEVPDDVGGRFSVFSAVGLLPAAICGIDVGEIQRGIQELDAQLQNPDIHQNLAAQNALIQVRFYERGKPVSVFMPYSYRLAPISDWYVQLWAESLGKKYNREGRVVHVGPTPVRAVGVTDQHSQVQLFNEGPNDKVITFVKVEKPAFEVTIPNQFSTIEGLNYLNQKQMNELMLAEFEATRSSLTANQRPNVTLSLPLVNGYSVAQLMYLLEVQTAIAGALLNIDPFDQPGVELGKKYTHALMGRKGFEHLIPEARGEKSPVQI